MPDKPDPKVETKEKATIEMRDLQIESLKMVFDELRREIATWRGAPGIR